MMHHMTVHYSTFHLRSCLVHDAQRETRQQLTAEPRSTCLRRNSNSEGVHINLKHVLPQHKDVHKDVGGWGRRRGMCWSTHLHAAAIAAQTLDHASLMHTPLEHTLHRHALALRRSSICNT